MDIAVAGFNPLALPGFDRGRSQRPAADPQPRSNNRSSEQDANPRGEKVVRGEVVSTRVNSNRDVNSTQRTVNERNSSAFNQSSPRRFSLNQALQTFQQNEALIARPEESRQVSGIIDEYV
ncbi:MAG: hypothetical protein OEY43_10545 [Gammaproteobacteria bacterium]|nr:hypothetical protein [Gammaproteobacteria bacterium]